MSTAAMNIARALVRANLVTYGFRQVIGGFQTLITFADGSETLVGPVGCNAVAACNWLFSEV